MRFFLILITYISGYTLCYGQTWNQIGSDIDGEAANDRCGQSVAISGDGSIVAIGANANNGTGPSSGHVRVFRNIGGVWVQQGSDIDGEHPGDNSGYSVALSEDGTIVAIGSNANDDSGNKAGQVQVFRYVTGNWIQYGNDMEGERFDDESGTSVALSADGLTVAVGAPYADSSGGQLNHGHVRVYRYTAGTWIQQGQDIDGERAMDFSGVSVDLNRTGTVVVIGAQGNDGNGVGAGHARVFEFVSNSWIQVGGDIDGEYAGDNSGLGVTIAADSMVVAVGSVHNSDNGGHAGSTRVYKLISNNWVQMGSDIDGGGPGERSGESVSLTADGTRIAIGAPSNSCGALASGNVRVFDFLAGTWQQVANDMCGEGANDHSGQACAISLDGTTVISGARQNTGAFSYSGHARVYGLGVGSGQNEKLMHGNRLAVFPNPVGNSFHLLHGPNRSIKAVHLYSTQGKELPVSFSSHLGVVKIPPETRSGAYLLKVVFDDGQSQSKIIVAK